MQFINLFGIYVFIYVGLGIGLGLWWGLGLRLGLRLGLGLGKDNESKCIAKIHCCIRAGWGVDGIKITIGIS